jgi:polyhydroxyalkanoate synthesis regulator phasin
LAGVEGKQLVEAQEQLAQRFAKLEASASEVAKIVLQLVERHEALAKQEAERVEALTRQLVERGEALAKQQAERVETLTKQLFERHEKAEATHREQLGRVLAAHRERDDEQHEELSEGLEKLERKLPPSHIRAG